MVESQAVVIVPDQTAYDTRCACVQCVDTPTFFFTMDKMQGRSGPSNNTLNRYGLREWEQHHNEIGLLQGNSYIQEDDLLNQYNIKNLIL